MTFKSEAEFEEALVRLLSEKGWEKEILAYKTEKELIDNWAAILFNNNRGKDRLNDCPLSEGEMNQILEQITALRTPLKLNGFINGKTITIVRDRVEDELHYGKEISLKIYDRAEIAAGQSRYQIAKQPIYGRRHPLLNDRRGDLMLLINGMPVIHIELKRSGVEVSNASYQIEKYAHEGIFTGLFSLVQVFVAMNPEETLYFANPGPDGKFNKDYFFHWADSNNEPMNDWQSVATSLLSIPMAHQLIGFYTVADDMDGILKVMRSYQYYAANAISGKVSKTKWEEEKQLGGYIWHTTGSGKTMTSFKSAQLIANMGDADKVVFLTDRIELGTQSLKEYRAFSDDRETVQATENTIILKNKLKSSAPSDTLIVTSIQKMSNIEEEEGGLNSYEIGLINRKRIVFIVDEAHRSTFGEMLITIKETFPRAIFFGFTGTPIHEENKKKLNTTATVFGNELHRYSIADGIRDKNVLGFDPYKILTFRDKDVRMAVALEKAKAGSEEEAISDPKKAEVFYRYLDSNAVPMAGYTNYEGKFVKGIEDFLPKIQYRTLEHQRKVVKDIGDNFKVLSRNHKFHAIFATSSIPEAIEYYKLIKEELPELKTTCLFDPNIDNKEGFAFKEDGLVEILEDYGKRYEKPFDLGRHAAFKVDVAARLAHKGNYKYIEREPEKQLDLLIVVDQMLTGFDSKWVNTLYLDKVLEYENIIQAFSRTNRLFGPEKPFGIIRYYRKPHTMEENIKKAVKSYSGDKVMGLFVDKLGENIDNLNDAYEVIESVFLLAGIENFERLPSEPSEKYTFAKLMGCFLAYLEAAKVQGLRLPKREYEIEDEEGEKKTYHLKFEDRDLLILGLRLKEFFDWVDENRPDDPATKTEGSLPYNIRAYLTEIDSEKIDNDYMNTGFQKYLKLLKLEGVSKEMLEAALNELHRTFASLSAEDQKYASIFLHDVERGEIWVKEGETLMEYITEYKYKAKNDQVHRFAEAFGLSEEKLREMLKLALNEDTINEFGRFDELKEGIDKEKARAYFESRGESGLNPFKVNIKTDRLLRRFILTGGFEI